MLRSHRRKAVLTAAALIATTGLLTACQGDADGGKKASGSGSSASDSDAKGKSDDAGAGGDDSAKSQSGSGSGAKPTRGKGVTGTWFGTVSYLAPGKYAVTDLKDTEQAFFTSTDTDIQGAGEPTPPSGYSPCSPLPHSASWPHR